LGKDLGEKRKGSLASCSILTQKKGREKGGVMS